jgi:hypothetical protein
MDTAPPEDLGHGAAARPPGVLGLTLRIVLFSFAPRAYQEPWFRARGASPLVATAFCALTEALGGAINLVDRPGEGPLWLLDLLFLIEGLTRLVIGLARGRAVGSLLGWPFRPLYRRWVRELPTPHQSSG